MLDYRHFFSIRTSLQSFLRDLTDGSSMMQLTLIITHHVFTITRSTAARRFTKALTHITHCTLWSGRRTPAYSCTILHTSENQWLNIHPDFSNALLIKRYSLWRLCRAATLALLISVFFTPSAWRQGAEMRSIISGRHRLCCHANSRQTDSFLICCCSIIGFGKNAFHQTTDKVSLKDELLSHSDLHSVCINPMEWWENIWV